VTFETVEECQILHKILALVSDDTDNRDMAPFHLLFAVLGKGWAETDYRAVGSISLTD
jgi:hypothetical protein